MMQDLVDRLRERDGLRTEAEVQADVRSYILTAPFELEDHQVKNVCLESQLGDRRRIDVEVGCTVIEVKRDLRKGKVKDEAETQLAGYVQTRSEQTGLRYVGVLTDGVDWYCYNVETEGCTEVSRFHLTSAKESIEKLTVWLEGVLATTKNIPATPEEIKARLGAHTSAHQLDRASLRSLYEQHKSVPTVALKRMLWSRLLTSALGTQFTDTDELFVEHTLLVNSAETIAHAVLGLDVASIDAKSLLTGAKFDESGVFGVVEADFFDWVVEVPGGQKFVSTLARRLNRFDWSNVNHDVLKVLYESIIGTDTRKRLGEYYTPDWLAEHIVDEAVDAPLNKSVLDPACGSGTFLFHAVRKYILEAERTGRKLPDILDGVTTNVIGMDLHPVAVTFARVTYLLAIGRDRLTHPERTNIQIPVYLGDSIQWRQQVDLLTAGNLVIPTDDGKELFSSELRFPDELIDNATNFDRLIVELSEKAANRKPGSAVPKLSTVYARLGIAPKHQGTVESTFKTMCRLNDEGRDHIWGYYIRNLARPMWLSKPKNRVDIVVGNPPWLAYRNMTKEMQESFKAMSQARGLWEGAQIATQQDLSALFVVRALQLYLKKAGSFALVLPNAAIDRAHFAGLRKGYFEADGEVLSLTYRQPWDLRRVRPHIFPRGACVLFGSRTDEAFALDGNALFWKGRTGSHAASWSETSPHLECSVEPILTRTITKSPYSDRFRNGATVFPRVLFIVEEIEAGPLGTPAGKVRVRSVQSANEKKPWKELARLEGIVESQFVRNVVMSDRVVPFRTLDPAKAVLPVLSSQYIGDHEDDLADHSGLSEWWQRSSTLWESHRASDRLSLSDQLNYQSKLSNQLPASDIRLVYNKSGMHVVASLVRDRRAIIENGLYWLAPHSEDEAHYLCAILNCPSLTQLVRPLMSYGKDERDIAKHLWDLPIPEFDPNNESHIQLATIGSKLEEVVATWDIDTSTHFPTLRRRLREQISDEGLMDEAEALIEELIS